MFTSNSFIRILLSALFFALLQQGLYAQLPSPVAHYPMNGNAQDISGYGNHGIPQSGASLTADQNGTPSSAYHFDGVNDFIEYTSASQFQPDFPITIAAWVKKEATSPNSAFMVFTNSYQDDYYDGVWLNINASNKITAAYGDGGGASTASRRSKTGISQLTPGAWHHVAVVIKGAKDMEVYLDGINDCGSYSGTGAGLSYPAGLPGTTAKSDGLGPGGGGGLIWGKGAVSDIRLYDEVLDQQEIWQIAFGNTNYPTDTLNCIPPNPDPCDPSNLNVAFNFSYQGGTTIEFNDLTTYSTPPTYMLWNFDDGTTQVTPPGVTFDYTFSSFGPAEPYYYEVCLTAVYRDDCDICSVTSCNNVWFNSNSKTGETEKPKTASQNILLPVLAREGRSTLDCKEIVLYPSFSSTISGLTVDFTDQSTANVNPTYMEWDFGELNGSGNPITTVSSMGNPVSHTYFVPGTYEVCLTAYVFEDCDECSEQYCEWVTVNYGDNGSSRQATPDVGEQGLSWSLYPNPTSSSVTVDLSSLEGKWEVIITDLTGKRISAHRVLDQKSLRVEGLATGMYIVSLIGEGQVDTKKLLVK